MAKKTKKKKTKALGRPRKKFSDEEWKIIDTALFFRATVEQLRFLLKKNGKEYCGKTIERNVKAEKGITFTEYRQEFIEGLKFKLVQTAIQGGLAKNTTLLIFCLKNLCDWSNKDKVEHSIKEGHEELVNYLKGTDLT